MFVYLDEDSCDHRLADRLASHGIDVVLGTEDGMTGASDEAQLARAARLQRPILTANRVDFLHLASEWAANGTEHAGIILWTQNIQSPESVADTVANVLASRSRERFRNAVVRLP